MDFIAPILAALRSLRFPILLGLAIAGYAVLFMPAFGNADPTLFRQQWGAWAWVDALTFTALSIAWVIDTSARAYWDHRKATAARKVLRFVPLHQQSWWHLAKQQDDSYVSQIHIDIQISNITDEPVQIVKVRLIRPKAELLQAHALLPLKGSPYHSHSHPAPPKGTTTASVHVLVRGTLAKQGKPIRITLGITDQYGEEYTLRNLQIRTNDSLVVQPPTFKRIQITFTRCLCFFRWRKARGEPQRPVVPWTFDPTLASIDIAASILMEEKRNYAACGRQMGGLGSLSVRLQSEPDHGVTRVGTIPSLLWKQGEGKPVISPNLERILKLSNGLSDDDNGNLERYLLAQLCKESSFGDVAYLIFLALHRMGRTVDALRTAREFLAGDKVYGYSNLLGTLSAVVSHEHYEIDVNLYPLMLDVLRGDTEHDFRLRDKINLARLEFLDRGSASSVPLT